jgi:hypothetical protein
MAGKKNWREQDPFLTVRDWGHWEAEEPFDPTRFTVPPNLPPERWW